MVAQGEGASGPRIERPLAVLGVRCSAPVAELLESLHIARPAPSHVAVFRRIAADPALMERLRGVRVDDFVLEILGFERLRPHLTRPFLEDMEVTALNEEALWWAAVLVDAALGARVFECVPICSISQLLENGDLARKALHGA